MTCDIRRKTGLIVRRGNEFLVGTILYSTDLRWSLSPWDAWITRDRDSAQRIAEIVDGELMLFNPVVGQIRKYRKENDCERVATGRA